MAYAAGNAATFVCQNDISDSHMKVVQARQGQNVSDVFCLEVYNGGIIGVFEDLGDAPQRYRKVGNIDEPKFYRKCCPLGSVYNTALHSCQPSGGGATEKINHFKSFRFLRIGLADCKIVLDYKSGGGGDSGTFKTEDFCIDRTHDDDSEVVRVCTNDYRACDVARCVHKCCADRHSFVNGSKCRATYVHGVDLNFSRGVTPSEDFGIVHGYSGKIYLQPIGWKFNLDDRGVFRVFDEKIGRASYEPQEETYCIEHATKNGVRFGYRLFRMYPESPIDPKYIVNGYVMIVSSVFLAITVVAYVFSRETKKLFGKTLVSFCTCLFGTFFLLIYSTFNLEFVKGRAIACRALGFLLLYGEFSTFVWLQLLCFDIYDAFGSGKLRNAPLKKNDVKRFWLYSVYGWGLPLCFTIVPVGLFYAPPVLPKPLEIKIGLYRCAIDRLDGNYADILFRTVPITLIQIVNLVLFFKTVKYCVEVKNEIKKMTVIDNQGGKTKNFSVNKERFMLVLKLSVIMGISYVFEVVSSFFDFGATKTTRYIEMAWDVINCLQGVFIFTIFVCKKKIFKRLKKHVAVTKLRKISLSSGATLTTTLSHDKEKDNKKRIEVALKHSNG